VIVSEGSPNEEQARQNLEVVAAQRRTHSPRTMTGSIEEVPLPDLLQLFSTSKKSGTLVVRTDEAVGRIYMEKGIIRHASINDLSDIPPLKSIFRMLSWQKGMFDVDPSENSSNLWSVEVSVQEILMESLRQLDEFNSVRDKLPDLSARLCLPTPLIPPLRELQPEDVDVLQLAHNYGRFETVLDRSLATDVDTAKIVLKLMGKGYLRVE
jgi:hypothetical protein